MRISDWSSDVCSSDLLAQARVQPAIQWAGSLRPAPGRVPEGVRRSPRQIPQKDAIVAAIGNRHQITQRRSEEHTSELQSLMRISYAVFCLKKKKKKNNTQIGKQQDEIHINKKSQRIIHD